MKASLRYRLFLGFIILVLGICSISFLRTVDVSAFENTIKVGVFPLNHFFDISEQGTISGYGKDYTDAVMEYTGWNYEYVVFDNWDKTLEALSDHKIDMIAPVVHTQQREEAYIFDSFPIGTEYGALMTFADQDLLIYEDFTSFNNLKTGCVKTSSFLESFESYEQRTGFSVNMVYYENNEDMFAALEAGEIKAIVANQMVMTDQMKLLARFGATSFYYMLNAQSSDICDQLNQSIDKLNSQHPEFQSQLEEIYFSDFGKVPFSKKELKYIAKSRVFNIACPADYAPFSYVDSTTGKVTGVDYAIFEQISQITGLDFKYIPMSFEENSQDFFEENDVTLVLEITNNQDGIRISSSELTEPYLSIDKYFFGLKDTKFDTEKAAKVAVVTSKDSGMDQWRNSYPNFIFVRYESVAASIEALREGEVNFLLNDSYSIGSFLDSPQNSDLELLPTSPVREELCVRLVENQNEEDQECLISILNKAIRLVDEGDKNRYLNDSLNGSRYHYSIQDFCHAYRIQIVFAGILVLTVIAGLFCVLYIQKKAKKAIVEDELKLRNITNNINGGVIVLKPDAGFEITYANDGFLELIGCSREIFEQRDTRFSMTYVHREDLEKIKRIVENGEKEMSIELRVMKQDGTYLPALFNCTSGQKINGEEELYCVIMDMTEQNALLEQLQLENRRTELILKCMEEIFYEVNLIQKTISTSHSFIEKLGWAFPDKVNIDDVHILEKIWHAAKKDIQELESATREMLDKKKPVSTVMRIESRPQECYVWCEVFQYPIISQEGEVVSVIGLIKNVDEQIKERERLLEQARRDPLTGLYNKEAFEEIVRKTLKDIPDKNHALIFIDMDHFKDVNDTLGHMVGDQVICDVADKLKIIFANYDLLSRFGGDEYCIFVKDIPEKTLRGKMEWLVDKLRLEYSGEKGCVKITCSCGVAFTGNVGFSYEILMKNADQALYYSKETGRDRFTFFHEIMENRGI